MSTTESVTNIVAVSIKSEYAPFDGLTNGTVRLEDSAGKILTISIDDFKKVIDVYNGNRGSVRYYKTAQDYNPYKVLLFSTVNSQRLELDTIDDDNTK